MAPKWQVNQFRLGPDQVNRLFPAGEFWWLISQTFIGDSNPGEFLQHEIFCLGNITRLLISAWLSASEIFG